MLSLPSGLFRPFLVTLPLFLLGCGGSTTPSDSAGDGDSGGDGDGAECNTEGATRPDEDGCNSCYCSEGSWSCTLMDCNPGACTDGETSSDGCNTCVCSEGRWGCTTAYCPPDDPAVCEEGAETDDGCNTCLCDGGQWSCTEADCPPDECSEGETRPTLDGCDTVCTCLSGTWSCESVECGRECTEGESRDDGCNSCTCSGGQWACTDAYCPPEEECSTGETKDAEDGCNTCTCSEGAWACTERACEEAGCGGLLGASCGPGEYCHYGTADTCGAADALGSCYVVPEVCDLSYNPVCGCDGKDYSNACHAHRYGVNVASLGECSDG